MFLCGNRRARVSTLQIRASHAVISNSLPLSWGKNNGLQWSKKAFEHPQCKVSTDRFLRDAQMRSSCPCQQHPSTDLIISSLLNTIPEHLSPEHNSTCQGFRLLTGIWDYLNPASSAISELKSDTVHICNRFIHPSA